MGWKRLVKMRAERDVREQKETIDRLTTKDIRLWKQLKGLKGETGLLARLKRSRIVRDRRETEREKQQANELLGEAKQKLRF
jgi:hypothetical protein